MKRDHVLALFLLLAFTLGSRAMALTIGQAKTYPDGSPVELSKVVVTGVIPSDDCLYVMETNRSSGIRVSGLAKAFGVTLSIGQLVDVSGQLDSIKSDGHTVIERRIIASSIVETSTAGQPLPDANTAQRPVLANIKTLNRPAPDMLGRLVKVVGKLSYSDPTSLLVDDQSMPAAPGMIAGLLLSCGDPSPPLQDGSLISAVGIVQGRVPSKSNPSTVQLRIRNWNDVATLHVFPAVECGRLWGRVLDSNGVGLSGVSVVANHGGYSTTTAADGSYIFNQVVPGTYSLTATNAYAQQFSIYGLVVSAGVETRGDIIAEPSFAYINTAGTDSTSAELQSEILTLLKNMGYATAVFSIVNGPDGPRLSSSGQLLTAQQEAEFAGCVVVANGLSGQPALQRFLDCSHPWPVLVTGMGSYTNMNSSVQTGMTGTVSVSGYHQIKDQSGADWYTFYDYAILAHTGSDPNVVRYAYAQGTPDRVYCWANRTAAGGNNVYSKFIHERSCLLGLLFYLRRAGLTAPKPLEMMIDFGDIENYAKAWFLTGEGNYYNSATDYKINSPGYVIGHCLAESVVEMRQRGLLLVAGWEPHDYGYPWYNMPQDYLSLLSSNRDVIRVVRHDFGPEVFATNKPVDQVLLDYAREKAVAEGQCGFSLDTTIDGYVPLFMSGPFPSNNGVTALYQLGMRSTSSASPGTKTGTTATGASFTYTAYPVANFELGRYENASMVGGTRFVDERKRSDNMLQDLMYKWLYRSSVVTIDGYGDSFAVTRSGWIGVKTDVATGDSVTISDGVTPITYVFDRDGSQTGTDTVKVVDVSAAAGGAGALNAARRLLGRIVEVQSDAISTYCTNVGSDYTQRAGNGPIQCSDGYAISLISKSTTGFTVTISSAANGTRLVGENVRIRKPFLEICKPLFNLRDAFFPNVRFKSDRTFR